MRIFTSNANFVKLPEALITKIALVDNFTMSHAIEFLKPNLNANAKLYITYSNMFEKYDVIMI